MGTGEPGVEQRQSPFLGMFEGFRTELDEHHDRRERVVKASRDITAASKKIIFALQRVRQLNQPIPPSISKMCKPHLDIVQAQLKAVSPDLQGMNAWRYHSQISPGFQEYFEAATFQHYLETQYLLPHIQAEKQLNSMIDGENVGRLSLPLEDYVLAAYDLTGELMRFSITSMATSGYLPGSSRASQSLTEQETKQEDSGSRERSALEDLQEIGSRLQGLDLGNDFTYFKRNADKKAETTQLSVEKVEKALYGLVVRGSERPKGWMPDLREEPRPEIESY